MRQRGGRALLVVLCLLPCRPSPARATSEDEARARRFAERSRQAEAEGLAQPFRGVATSQGIAPGLFSLRSTGVSTEPVRQAALGFLAALKAEQRGRTVFPVEDDEWRKWMNQHFYVRQGTGFTEMTEAQRQAAFDLMGASLSARGLRLSRDVMRLNETLAELRDNFEEFGEWLYWITVMGEPSASEPWGWQLDGHHLVVNYFVLGDQVVMTPFFVGSEPVVAEAGKYRGTAILQDEQNEGLALFQALTPEQRAKAVLEGTKASNRNLAEAFKDNLVLDYAGVPVSSFAPAQKAQLVRLVLRFVGNMDDAHAAVRMKEVEAHLDETHFAWIGESGKDAVFYYRIHSPVILIEFDHQLPANLRDRQDPDRPHRQHIHVVVRTPNGNDYGKDLLRQHYETHPHHRGERVPSAAH
jgi:Spy/CpxP family protein refolding chaperone